MKAEDVVATAAGFVKGFGYKHCFTCISASQAHRNTYIMMSVMYFHAMCSCTSPPWISTEEMWLRIALKHEL